MNPEQKPAPTSPFDPARLRAFAAGHGTLAELVGMPASHVRRLCDRGERLLAAGAAGRAATLLRGVVALAPFDARAHALLGAALVKQQALEAAEVHFRRALEIRRHADDVRVALAELLLLTARRPEALRLLRAVLANPAARATEPGRRATLLLAAQLGVTVPAQAAAPRPPIHELPGGIAGLAPVTRLSPAHLPASPAAPLPPRRASSPATPVTPAPARSASSPLVPAAAQARAASVPVDAAPPASRRASSPATPVTPAPERRASSPLVPAAAPARRPSSPATPVALVPASSQVAGAAAAVTAREVRAHTPRGAAAPLPLAAARPSRSSGTHGAHPVSSLPARPAASARQAATAFASRDARAPVTQRLAAGRASGR